VGRSTWWKERDNAGRLIALWPLRPDRVGPIYGVADDAGADRVLAGWSYLVPGTTTYVPIPRQDVLLFNIPDPMGESGGLVEGLGALQVLASEIGADNEATKYVGSLLANDARPGTVLEVAGAVTSQDDADLIKAAYTSQYGGRNRGKVGVVDKGTKVISVGFNLQQLEFPALRRISESRVCAAFGVPAMLVGLLVGLEHSTFSNYAEAREFFAETTCANYWRRFSDTFTNDIAAEYGVNIVCTFDLTKVRSLAAQAIIELDRTRDAYDRGVISPNEYREALNLPPHPDGDFLPAAQKPQLALAASDPETGAKASAIDANGKVVADSKQSLVKAA
jgi:HK97 family phage portal protein